jgi:hypothetical protein
MHDFQLKEFLEGIEVAVAGEQGVIVRQAERGNEAVDGLSYGLASRAKSSVVARRARPGRRGETNASQGRFRRSLAESPTQNR